MNKEIKKNKKKPESILQITNGMKHSKYYWSVGIETVKVKVLSAICVWNKSFSRKKGKKKNVNSRIIYSLTIYRDTQFICCVQFLHSKCALYLIIIYMLPDIRTIGTQLNYLESLNNEIVACDRHITFEWIRFPLLLTSCRHQKWMQTMDKFNRLMWQIFNVVNIKMLFCTYRFVDQCEQSIDVVQLNSAQLDLYLFLEWKIYRIFLSGFSISTWIAHIS